MLSIFLLSLACSKNLPLEAEPEPQPELIDCEDITRDGDNPLDNIEAVSASDVDFALELWAELDTKNNNQFISPYSMTSALGMLHLGAAGASEQELRSVLNISEDDAAWHDTKGMLTQELHQPERCDYQLSIANRLFAQNDYPFHSDFLDAVDSIYGAPVQTVDFEGNPEGGRQAVNAWVSEQTKGHIPELFKEGTINEITRLVLANAIYLNAPWATPFQENLTSASAFETEDGSEIVVDTMHNYELDMRYYSDDMMEAASLIYQGDELSMTFYVPRDGVSLSELEAEFGQAMFHRVQAEQFYTLGEVHIPKFEFRTELQLNEPLSNMGMPSLFSDEANLSGMSNEPLYVKSVVHEAWIKVEEKGNEAATAPGVDVGVTSAPVTQYFAADRAFLFTIQDDLTGTLLFMGRVADPSAGPE